MARCKKMVEEHHSPSTRFWGYSPELVVLKVLTGRDQHRDRHDTLPCAVDVGPGVDKSLAAEYGLTLLRALSAKDADDNGRVAVHINLALFGHGLRRRLISGRFQAGQKFALGLDAAVDINRHEAVSQQQIESFGVVGLESAVPGVVQRQHMRSLVGLGRRLRHQIRAKAERQCENEDWFHDERLLLVRPTAQHFSAIFWNSATS